MASCPCPLIRDRSERTELAAQTLDLVVLGREDRQKVPVTLLELRELGVVAGEFAGEPLVEIPKPGNAGLARVGLLARGPGGCPPLLELVLEVAPGSIDGRAGDARLAGERLDVAGASGRDLPGQ